jgi:hypothetical protein
VHRLKSEKTLGTGLSTKYMFSLHAVSSANYHTNVPLHCFHFTLPMTTFILFSELSKLLHHILPFTAGGFLNIALVSVVPPLMQVK